MLPQKKRLSRAEFSRFFASGKRIPMSFGVLVYTPDQQQKAAVVVGKKVYKKAVARNRLRRQLYHMLRDWFAVTTDSGVYIIITKPTAATMTPAALQTELYRALKTTQ